MARIDWIVAKLNNWALWKQNESVGGAGYPTQSVLLSNPVDRCREIDLRTTIDNVEAELTDKAVSSLRLDHRAVYDTVVCIYIEDCGVPGTARKLGKAVSTVHANLGAADQLLRLWFNAHEEKQAALKRTFTT